MGVQQHTMIIYIIISSEVTNTSTNIPLNIYIPCHEEIEVGLLLNLVKGYFIISFEEVVEFHSYINTTFRLPLCSDL